MNCEKKNVSLSLPSSPAAFIRVVGSEFVQKYLGEGPRMVRDVFRLAKENAPAIIFIDEIDAIATKRFDAQTGGTRLVVSLIVLLQPSSAHHTFCLFLCFTIKICSDYAKQFYIVINKFIFTVLPCGFPPQLTGKCRESYLSCLIKWMDLTRTSTSR